MAPITDNRIRQFARPQIKYQQEMAIAVRSNTTKCENVWYCAAAPFRSHHAAAAAIATIGIQPCRLNGGGAEGESLGESFVMQASALEPLVAGTFRMVGACRMTGKATANGGRAVLG
jgi:hypothetical protein